MSSVPRSLAGVLLLTLCGCASTSPWEDPAPAVASDDKIEAPSEVVWEALPRVYAFLGLEPIDEVDRVAHSVAVIQRVRIRNGIVGSRDEPLARCSAAATINRTDSGGNFAFRRVNGIATVRVRSAVSEAGDGARLRTELVASAEVPAPSSAAPLNALCTTTGRLESQIAEGVRAVVSPSDRAPSRPSPDRGSSGRRPF